jgi:chromatin assembly factor 1 subunit B
VACGDGGAIVVWSVPISKRGGGNGKHYWNLLTSEKELSVKVLRSWGEDIFDVDWSPDSKRFAVGTLDHKVAFYEDMSLTENQSSDAAVTTDGAAAPTTWGGSGTWKNVCTLSDHKHYVQGVAFDPLNCYVATQGSDRNVFVFQRKEKKNSTKKAGALKESSVVNESAPAAPTAAPAANAATTTTNATEVAMADENDTNNENAVAASAAAPAVSEAASVTGAAKFELTKSKQLKWRIISDEGAEHAAQTNSDVIEETAGDAVAGDAAGDKGKPKVQRHNLYVDETMQSFFRRLTWTPDGAYMITPAGLYQETEESRPSFATHVFSRHNFEKPLLSLLDEELPSVVVRACPVQFKRPATDPTGADAGLSVDSRPDGRSVFAVLTTRGVFVYDTHHDAPLVVCKGLHYAGLTDAAWTPDGRKLLVTSSDGYLSLLSFEDGELGDLVDSAVAAIAEGVTKKVSTFTASAAPVVAAAVAMPPCAPGESAALEAPPAKKARKTIAPTLVSQVAAPAVAAAASTATSADAQKGTKRRIAPTTVVPGAAVERISPSTVETALGQVSLKTGDSDGGASSAGGDENAVPSMEAGQGGEALKKKKRITPISVPPTL